MTVPGIPGQVLQHRMVDMVISYEQARSMACLACVKVDTAGAAERRRGVSPPQGKGAAARRPPSQEAVPPPRRMGMSGEPQEGHPLPRPPTVRHNLLGA